MTDINKLCEELRAGVSVSGETSTGVELYDIDGAETVMHRAADALTALERRIAELEAERADHIRRSGKYFAETCKLEARLATIRAETLEEAAKVAEGGQQSDGSYIFTVEGEAIAAALRALGGEHG